MLTSYVPVYIMPKQNESIWRPHLEVQWWLPLFIFVQGGQNFNLMEIVLILACVSTQSARECGGMLPQEKLNFLSGMKPCMSTDVYMV